jgi:FtsX-like permease family
MELSSDRTTPGEEHERNSRTVWFDRLGQDLRYAMRQPWRAPGLVKSPFDGQWFFSYPAYQRLQHSTGKSAPILARSGISEGILQSPTGSAERARYQLVSNNFFDVLGIAPRRGRFFDGNDSQNAGQSEWPAVVRCGYWKESFGTDPSIIGKRAVDARLPITKIVPLREEYDEGLSREKLLARLAGAFGFLAQALATVGFYGLLSFNVARRTREIGVRMALGATPAQVRGLVLRQTLRILVAGIVPGIAFMEAARGGVRALLYGSSAIDFWALGLAIGTLALVGVIAAWHPARRASTIDPGEALRAE